MGLRSFLGGESEHPDLSEALQTLAARRELLGTALMERDRQGVAYYLVELEQALDHVAALGGSAPEPVADLVARAREQLGQEPGRPALSELEAAPLKPSAPAPGSHRLGL